MQLFTEMQDDRWYMEEHVQLKHLTSDTARSSNEKKPEKFPRPTIDLDSTAEAWQEFHTSWLQYKDEYALSGKACTRQLYACCSNDLATNLSRTTGGTHFELTETQIIETIKNLAV